jgi:quercetin dioxygenase-like cupin family protein
MPTGAYTRRTITELNGVEITWSPGARTPKHDHGAVEHGVVLVVRGEVCEIRNDKLKIYRASEMFSLHGETRHIVGNWAHEPAVTMHMYSSQLSMQTFPLNEEEIKILRELDARCASRIGALCGGYSRSDFVDPVLRAPLGGETNFGA